MAGTGGARPGAGRKPKAERHETAIKRAEKRISDRLPDLVDKLFELAEGVTVRENGPNGQERIYDRPPCFKSASYLIDRVMGKPKQAVENTGPDGGAILVRVVYDDLPPDDPSA